MIKNKTIIAVVIFLLRVTATTAQPDTLKGVKMTLENAPEPTGDMLVRISEIEVYPEYLEEYLNFALTVGTTSVSEEPGVIAIFPLIQQRDSCQIRILEIYAGQEAYRYHIETEHFQLYKQGTLHMVKHLELVDMYPMNPSGMPEIFRKLSMKTHE